MSVLRSKVLWLFFALHSVALAANTMSSELFSGLSEQEQFQTFPYVDKAFRYAEAEHWQQAIDEIIKAQHLAPDHTAFALQEVRYLMAAERFDDALQHLLVLDSANNEIETRLWDLWLQTGQNEALETFRQSIDSGKYHYDQVSSTNTLYLIKKHFGLKHALSIAGSLPQDKLILSSTAQWAFDDQQWEQAIKDYQTLASMRSLTEEEAIQSGQAFVHLNDAQSAWQQVAQIGRPASSSLIVKQLLYSSYDREDDDQALRALDWLEKYNFSGSKESKAKLDIYEKEQNWTEAVMVANSLQLPCIRQIDLLIKADMTSEAVKKLNQCEKGNISDQWLNYAESIASTNIIASARTEDKELRAKQAQILANRYLIEENYEQLLKISTQLPDDLERTRFRAISQQALGQYREAAKNWYTLYQTQNDFAALGTASYLMRLDSQAEIAVKMITASISPSELLKHQTLATSLLDLYRTYPLLVDTEYLKALGMQIPDSRMASEDCFALGQCRLTKEAAEPRLLLQLAYLLEKDSPAEALKLFKLAREYPVYQTDFRIPLQIAMIHERNGNPKETRESIKTAIDLVPPTEQELLYAQDSYRNAHYGAYFGISGWIGHNIRSNTPQIIGSTSKYFTLMETGYSFQSKNFLTPENIYFNLLSGGDDKPFENNELDFGGKWRLIHQRNVFLRVGLRQGLNNDRKFRSYLRASADLIADSDYQKAWRLDKEQWWTQSLYTDATYYLNDNDYALYVRYEAGPMGVISHVQRQRWRTYGLLQGDLSDYSLYDTGSRYDMRTGFGVGWLSEWQQDAYAGFLNQLEVNIEWQLSLASDYARSGDNSLLLRFSWQR